MKMRKGIAKNARITESTIETAKMISKSCERLGILFLLIRKEMSPEEIQNITGKFMPLISSHLRNLEKEQIITRGYYRISKEVRADCESPSGIFFEINEDIRDELVLIINSFLKIQDVLERYKKERKEKN